jgi:hypothetical protein
MDVGPAWIVWTWSMLHVGALLCAWGTRLAVGSRFEWLLQAGLFVAMGGVGGAAWICRHLDRGVWMFSAVTLMAMVLTVVIDFRRLGETVHAATPTTAR